VSLLSDVVRALDAAEVRYALIGAAAMAVHGVSRATADVDLFTVDTRVLRKELWDAFGGRGVRLRLLKGDLDDPLAGSVRLADGADVVDVVVGRSAWEREQVEAAVVRAIGELELPVMQPTGLVLLKLHAGGPKDAWDIQALLEVTEDAAGLIARVERALPRLPADARQLWSRIRIPR
jgi:predicted nucleotidyltransferase